MEASTNQKLDPSKIQLTTDKDPVCGMSVKNGFSDTAHYDGKIIGFCSPGCKEEFKKEPAKFLK
jgi:YHS domain-containing protein